MKISCCWQVRVITDDQESWQRFCEEFLSPDIAVLRTHDSRGGLLVTCYINVNPFEPIDSTGSMPSFTEQARAAGFRPEVKPL